MILNSEWNLKIQRIPPKFSFQFFDNFSLFWSKIFSLFSNLSREQEVSAVVMSQCYKLSWPVVLSWDVWPEGTLHAVVIPLLLLCSSSLDVLKRCFCTTHLLNQNSNINCINMIIITCTPLTTCLFSNSYLSVKYTNSSQNNRTSRKYYQSPKNHISIILAKYYRLFNQESELHRIF